MIRPAHSCALEIAAPPLTSVCIRISPYTSQLLPLRRLAGEPTDPSFRREDDISGLRSRDRAEKDIKREKFHHREVLANHNPNAGPGTGNARCGKQRTISCIAVGKSPCVEQREGGGDEHLTSEELDTPSQRLQSGPCCWLPNLLASFSSFPIHLESAYA